MSDQSVQTKSTQIACIVDLEGQRGEIQGGFFWWSFRFSVPKWKTRCRQQDLLVQKNQLKRASCWPSQFFQYGSEKLEEQLNVQTKSTQIACIVDLEGQREEIRCSPPSTCLRGRRRSSQIRFNPDFLQNLDLSFLHECHVQVHCSLSFQNKKDHFYY